MEKVEKGEVVTRAPDAKKTALAEMPIDTAPAIEWAVFYAKIGLKIFPVMPRTKNKYYPDYEHRGKPSKKYPKGNPYSWHAQATNSIEEVKRIWKKHPDANIGCCTGEGFYGLDIDERPNGNGFDSIHKWEREGILPDKLNIDTWTSITGSGGEQLFYYLPHELEEIARNNHIDLAGDAGMIEPSSHVDTRGDGRYVILPPSIHPNGERYRWADGKSPSDIPIADFDRTVEYLFTQKGSKKKGKKNSIKHELASGEKIPKGSRRAYMLSKAGELVNKLVDTASDSVIVAALMKIAHTDLDLSEPLDSGWDGLERDMEKVVSDYRASIEKEREEGQTTDWKYCMRAWYMDHPNEKPQEPIDWNEIRAAGEKRKKKELSAARSDKQPDKLSDDPEGKPEIVQPEFFLSKKGQIISDVRNAKVFLDFILKGCIRYNNLTNRVDIFGVVPWNKDVDEVRPWKDTDTSNALMLANGYGLKNKNYLIDAISIIAEENKYHPIKDYLESLEYLGEGYIRRLAVEYMGCEDSEYTYECMKLLLLAMVQRVYYPGCKYDYVLIFQGPQGSYKSTFWKTLSRDDDWFSDCVESFKSRKDLGELLQGKWLVELSEMSAFKKSEIESIKAAVTSQCDSYREAYGRFRSDYPRTTIFVGTTNNQTFLKDSTGNRRFIILPINKERRTKDLFTCDTRDQDFEGALAEALHIFKEFTKNGKPMPLVLPKSVLAEAEERQNNANAYDEWTGIIDSWLEKQVKEKTKRYTSGLDIWVNCLSRDKGSYSSKETARINQILDSLPDWERSPSVRITDGFENAPLHGRGFKYVGEIPEDVPFD